MDRINIVQIKIKTLLKAYRHICNICGIETAYITDDYFFKFRHINKDKINNERQEKSINLLKEYQTAINKIQDYTLRKILIEYYCKDELTYKSILDKLEMKSSTFARKLTHAINEFTKYFNF